MGSESRGQGVGMRVLGEYGVRGKVYGLGARIYGYKVRVWG